MSGSAEDIRKFLRERCGWQDTEEKMAKAVDALVDLGFSTSASGIHAAAAAIDDPIEGGTAVRQALKDGGLKPLQVGEVLRAFTTAAAPVGTSAPTPDSVRGGGKQQGRWQHGGGEH